LPEPIKVTNSLSNAHFAPLGETCCGGDASEVNIVLSEIEAADWASGGVLFSESSGKQPNASSGFMTPND